MPRLRAVYFSKSPIAPAEDDDDDDDDMMAVSDDMAVWQQ
jgi:hypothetical protein